MWHIFSQNLGNKYWKQKKILEKYYIFFYPKEILIGGRYWEINILSLLFSLCYQFEAYFI